MNSVKNYYISTPFAKSSKAKTEAEKNIMASNLWALFTALETVEYAARNLSEHYQHNAKKQMKQIAKYNRGIKQQLFGRKLEHLQSEQLNESVLNSSAVCIEAMGHTLTIPDEYLDEFLLCLENKAKELHVKHKKK